jgi:transposase
MKKLDMRKLDKQTRLELKQIAVSAVLSVGSRNISKVARQYKLRRKTLSGWVSAYKKGGKKSLSKDGRGARKWQNTALTKTEESWVKKVIINKYPEQFQPPFMLWNRASVRDLIKNKYNKKLGLTTVSRLLDKWNMTPQKPAFKSYKQQPSIIQKWINKEYPQIKRKAKREKALIHWGDETSISSREIIAKGFALKGKTPILAIPSSRFSVNMVSAIANNGSTRFMIFENRMSGKVFIEFLRRLIKDQASKIYLILDNSTIHHARIVKAWEVKHKDEIKLFYLPPYTPEHNPTEYLNQTLKVRLKNRPKDKTRPELRNSVSQEMKSLQSNRHVIVSLFDAPLVNYARG